MIDRVVINFLYDDDFLVFSLVKPVLSSLKGEFVIQEYRGIKEATAFMAAGDSNLRAVSIIESAILSKLSPLRNWLKLLPKVRRAVILGAIKGKGANNPLATQSFATAFGKGYLIYPFGINDFLDKIKSTIDRHFLPNQKTESAPVFIANQAGDIKRLASQAPFINFDCFYYCANCLLPTALFGAFSRQPSLLLQMAHGGTLVLRNIEHLPLEQQERVVELAKTGCYRAGPWNDPENKTYYQCRVSVICATKQPVPLLIEEKKLSPGLIACLSRNHQDFNLIIDEIFWEIKRKY